MRKFLIALMGPSGCGKSTLVAETARRLPGVVRLTTSVTTRTPRADDMPGEFRHVSRAEFEALIAGDALVQWVEYDGNLYGDERSVPEAILAAGLLPIRPMTEGGVAKFRAAGFEVFAVRVRPHGHKYAARSSERRAEDALREDTCPGDMTILNDFDAPDGLSFATDLLTIAVAALAEHLSRDAAARR